MNAQEYAMNAWVFVETIDWFSFDISDTHLRRPASCMERVKVGQWLCHVVVLHYA